MFLLCFNMPQSFAVSVYCLHACVNMVNPFIHDHITIPAPAAISDLNKPSEGPDPLHKSSNMCKQLRGLPKIAHNDGPLGCYSQNKLLFSLIFFPLNPVTRTEAYSVSGKRKKQKQGCKRGKKRMDQLSNQWKNSEATSLILGTLFIFIPIKSGHMYPICLAL